MHTFRERVEVTAGINAENPRKNEHENNDGSESRKNVNSGPECDQKKK
jgi:hypothetical protein